MHPKCPKKLSGFTNLSADKVKKIQKIKEIKEREQEKIKEIPYPTSKEHDTMNTSTQKLKNLRLSGFKRIAGKRARKVGSRDKKIQKAQRFDAVCHWAAKGIWTLSLSLSGNLCFAANADGYAFTGALFNIMNELKGAPIAIITAIGIIAAGFFWVFKGHEVGLKQVISALVGGGLVMAAPTLVTMVPGMTGAVI
jgi:type IV secretory pathway VirB2 component (pilin)